jgi:hypothetical protein
MDRFGVERVALLAMVKVVDNVGIGDDRKIKLAAIRGGGGLTRP